MEILDKLKELYDRARGLRTESGVVSPAPNPVLPVTKPADALANAAVQGAQAMMSPTPKQTTIMPPEPQKTVLQRAEDLLKPIANVIGIPGAAQAIDFTKGAIEQAAGIKAEEPGVMGQLGQEVVKKAKDFYGNVINPVVVVPMAQMKINGDFYRENDKTLQPILKNVNDLDQDGNVLDQMAPYFQKKRDLLNDTSKSMEEKLPVINELQDKIFEIANTNYDRGKSFDGIQMPSAAQLEDVVNKYQQFKYDKNSQLSALATPKTPEQIKDENLTATIRQDTFSKIAGPMMAKPGANVDIPKTLWTFITNENIDHILMQPQLTRAHALDLLAMAKTPDEKKYYQDMVAKEDAMINNNNTKVIPYLQYMASMLVQGHGDSYSINELTDSYLKRTHQSITDIMGEDDLGNKITSSILMSPRTLVMAPGDLIGESREQYKKNYADMMKLNRGDVAQQDEARLRFYSGNAGQKVMEGIGLGMAELENGLNTIKGQFYKAPSGVYGLGRMDMESLANLDSTFTPPEGWGNKTWSNLKNFSRQLAQKSPEIAANIAVFKGAGAVTDVAEGAIAMRRVSQLEKLGDETAGLVKAGDSFSNVSAELAKGMPKYTELINAGKTPIEALKEISKTDYVASKLLATPLRIAVNNYLMSATMQSHNPKAYSVDNFLIDSAFGALDLIIETNRALKGIPMSDVQHKGLFLDGFSKKFFDVPEESRVKLAPQDKAAFNEASQQYIAEYNEIFNHFNPDDLQKYAQRVIKNYSKAPVTLLVDKARQANPEWTLTYSSAIDADLIPKYVKEEDFNAVMASVKNEDEAKQVFQQLKNKDVAGRTNGLTEGQLADKAEAAIGSFVVQGKLKADPNAGVFRNFIDDVDTKIGKEGKIKVDGEEYTYTQKSQNLNPQKGDKYKAPSGETVESQGHRATTRYVLTKDGEELIYKTNPKTGQEVIAGILGVDGERLSPQEYQDRTLTFFKDPSKKDAYRGTRDQDRYGRQVKTVEEIRPGLPEQEAATTKEVAEQTNAVVPQQIMTAQESATAGALTVSNTAKLRQNTVADKLHRFSNLSDAEKRSNIPNAEYNLSKAPYQVGDKPLRVSLDETAHTIGEDGKHIPLTAEQQEVTTKFITDTADQYFPQYPELRNKITDKMAALSLEGKQKRTMFGTRYQADNEIAVISRLAEPGSGIGEFLKFFDPDKYKEIRDNPDAFKSFWNVDFPDVDWNRYNTLWKYIANDTSESQMIKGIAKRSGLNAGVYKFGQTLVNIAGIPKMLVMNSLAFVTEILKGYKMVNYTNEEAYNIRAKYNLLFSADEYKYDALSQIDGGLERTARQLQAKITDFYKSGLYNAADVFYSSSIKNKSVGQAIEEILPQLKGPEEFDAFIKGLPEATVYDAAGHVMQASRMDTLKQIQDRAEQLMNKRTGQYVDFRKSKVTFGGDMPQLKQALYRTYSLMGGWGMGMLHSSIETITQAIGSKLIRGGYGKNYLHILERDGKVAADKWALSYVQKSDDFLHFTEKMAFALSMGFKQDRIMADNDGEKDFITTLQDGLTLGANYSFPIQSFQSSPFGRAILAFVGGIADDVNNDGKITGMDIAAGGVDMGKQVITDFFRRFSIPKSAILATSQTLSRGEGFKGRVENMVSAFQKATGGYLYYSSQEVTQNGFDEYIPLTPRSSLMELMPYTDKYLGDYRAMDSKAQMQRLLTDRDTYGDNRIAYNLPFVSQWNMGKFEDNAITKNVVDTLSKDEFYTNNILHGDIDRNVMGADGRRYAYSQLTDMASVGSKKNPTQWFDNMTQNFNFESNGQVIVSKTKQNQEDLFVEMMKDSMKDGAYQNFVDMFNTSVNGNQKAAIRMLAFADAQSPGAGKEILANLVSGERSTLMHDHRVNGSPDPAASKQVEEYLGATYGNLMYTTDKPVGRKNMALFYARQVHPDIADHISDPYDKNGRPMKNMNFIYVAKDTGEEPVYKNSLMSQLFVMDMTAKMKVASGDVDGFKMANAFATIRMPKGTDEKSMAYNNMMLNGLNHTLNYINTSHLSTEDKIELKAGVFVGVYNKLGNIAPAMMSSEYKDTFAETMRFLHGTTAEITQLGKEKGAELYFKDTSGNSFSNSKYYSSAFKPYGQTTQLYDQMQKIGYLFSPYKNYGTTSRNYGSKYYSSKDRDYLVEYGKSRATGVARISGGGQKQDFDKDKPLGRSPVQKGGTARQFTKREDPDKSFDFTTVSTFKRKLSRKAIKYDNSGVRKSGLGGGLYHVSYQGGDRKRRVSRTKGGDAKGSAKYYKTGRQVFKT